MKPPEEDIFAIAAALPADERGVYLDDACAGQPDLRARVEALLRAHEAEGFMEDPAPLESRPFGEESGTRIGRYRLLQPIGEGGFGIVWMAEQVEPVTRRVALKIIKAGMDTREVIARFEAERQALAMMDHPNIAQVHDAGATESGRPYFVMELVRGIPITQFCDEHQLNTRERLELFGDVCSAINHAHQKGVIHRDIKPTNVLVTRNGERPVVKVIDFGIAKAIEGRLTDHTLFTRFEQFVGTPAYMSPEQASLCETDIDTRSDIYSLGVLLYELLTGAPPFDVRTLASAGHEEMRRLIREVDPPLPSTRLGTLSGDQRTAVARTRHALPDKLQRLVEPDLDWIVMKALEKDRSRRYATANGLAADIQRLLSNEPVSAGPPTAAYRFRKFAQRHRVALQVVSGIALVLVTTTVLSLWMAVRAVRAEKRATRRAAGERLARIEADNGRREIDHMYQFFAGILNRSDPGVRRREMTAREAIALSIEDLHVRLHTATAIEIDQIDGTIWILYKLGFTSEVVPLQEKVRNFYVAQHGARHPKSLIASLDLAFYTLRGSRTADRLEKSRLLLEELVAYEADWPPELIKGWIETLENLAWCYDLLNYKAAAIAMREKVLSTCQTLYADDSRWTLEAMVNLATLLSQTGRIEEAIVLREKALNLGNQVDGPDHPKTLATQHGLANLYHNNGRMADALKLREEILPKFHHVLGKNHKNTLMAQHNFAESCFVQGQQSKAIALMEDVLDRRPGVSGPYHVDTLEAMCDLALFYHEAGRHDEALALRRRVFPLRREHLAPDHEHTLESMEDLAESLHDADQSTAALDVQRALLALRSRKLGWTHPATVKAAMYAWQWHPMFPPQPDSAPLRARTP